MSFNFEKLNSESRVKIDVGTSITAPNSELWLRRCQNMIVYGFEPCATTRDYLLSGKYYKENYFRLDLERMNKTFFLYPYAIDDVNGIVKKEFHTTNILGCSSLYKPSEIDDTRIAKTETVECLPLSLFFDSFPWDKVPYIEHLKIDAQGNDFRVLKSCGKYLEKIVFVTIEIGGEHIQYRCNEENSGHSYNLVNDFMTANNFALYNSPICNPFDGNVYTYQEIIGGNYNYVNKKYLDIVIEKDLDCSHLGL